ncbi:Gfo/Idh/MocA family protein [Lewinella sp. 4G2]|uniref:Gfo/Idh/MocA family protein n=1 Tax=Lewinella sp. 4G2 TaxID=1803372 RepID=UPI0007B4D7DD|nr:Gfo/Idh/MocA family oxidoreductase [Lewinella sp. 4G2]OAV44264.1 glucose-fructose oxidoreductase [Lewinella sp. 4G2]
MLNRRSFNKALATSLSAVALTGLATQACANPAGKEGKLGIALVGLGSYSKNQLGPALKDAQHCYLAGIVTGSPDKVPTWQKEYGIPDENVYNYDSFDAIKDNDAIDVVYVVLPNSMHADFCIRAARAGKHVICEKPMAVSVEECDAIIDACAANNVKLGMGYRLQYEPYTQEIKRLREAGDYGKPLYVQADAAYRSTSNPGQWRLDKSLSGGGALLNMGVYAIQAAIYATGQNPTSVSAQEFSTRPDYFKDTDETVTAQLTFPGDVIGNIFTSHNVSANRLHVATDTNAWYGLQPATGYGPLAGMTSDGKEISFPHESQQKLQMDGFARHILEGIPNLAPGEMGKRDMIICEAIYASIAAGGKRMDLDLGRMGIVA